MEIIQGIRGRESFSIAPARYTKNQMVVCIEDLERDASPGATNWKTRGAWLAEHLGGRYVGRSGGYHLSPNRAEQWNLLHGAGFAVELFSKPLVFKRDGKEYTLKQALEIARGEQQ